MWYVRVVSLALLGLSSACGASRSTPASGPEPSANETAVQIDNQNIHDMTIYILKNGSRFLLGQANGLSRTILTIKDPLRGDGRMTLLADPIGGDRPITSPTLVVPPGQRIFWTIGSDPATSTASTG